MSAVTQPTTTLNEKTPFVETKTPATKHPVGLTEKQHNPPIDETSAGPPDMGIATFNSQNTEGLSNPISLENLATIATTTQFTS